VADPIVESIAICNNEDYLKPAPEINMPGMLYYPFVNASPTAINQAVLYWDFLSTVVPAPDEIHLNDSMREISNRGFYRPIEGATIFSFATGNFDILTRLAADLPLDDILPPTSDSSLESRRLYVSKLGPDVTDDLIRRGLATPVPNIDGEGRWSGIPQLLVAAKLQTALMSIAIRQYVGYANYKLGTLGDASLSPFTDEAFAFENAHHVPGGYRLTEQNLCIELGRLLPAPQEGVTISDLFYFRERYDDERRRLMLALELLLSGISQQFEHSQDVFKAMQSEIESALRDMRKAARSHRLGLAARSLAVFIAAGSAGAAARIPEGAWILGVIGGAAINIATQEVRQGDTSSNYSYLYRVARTIKP
jgi:hypothetical protein